MGLTIGLRIPQDVNPSPALSAHIEQAREPTGQQDLGSCWHLTQLLDPTLLGVHDALIEGLDLAGMGSQVSSLARSGVFEEPLTHLESESLHQPQTAAVQTI